MVSERLMSMVVEDEDDKGERSEEGGGRAPSLAPSSVQDPSRHDPLAIDSNGPSLPSLPPPQPTSAPARLPAASPRALSLLARAQRHPSFPFTSPSATHPS